MNKIKKDTGQVPDVKSPGGTSETMLTNNVSIEISVTKIEDTVNKHIVTLVILTAIFCAFYNETKNRFYISYLFFYVLLVTSVFYLD